MEIGDWITLAAILVALGLGVLSLWQTRDIRQREQRAKLLNEIIEWATSAREWDFTKEDRDRLKGEIVMKILRVGHIMSRYALGLNRNTIDEKIKCLMSELLKTHTRLSILRGQIVFLAAEDLITEVGKLIPSNLR